MGKEERFLSMVYPLLCLGSGLTIDTILKQWVDTDATDKKGLQRTMLQAAWAKIVQVGVTVALVAFVLLSVSRTYALVHNFGATFAVYSALPLNAEKVCVGKEWYRFPSSFFLPRKAGDLLWYRAGFYGQLPQPYGPWPAGLS